MMEQEKKWRALPLTDQLVKVADCLRDQDLPWYEQSAREAGDLIGQLHEALECLWNEADLSNEHQAIVGDALTRARWAQEPTK